MRNNNINASAIECTNNENLPEISYYRPPIANTSPASSINILNVHQKITTDPYLKGLCEEIRLIGNKKERNTVKDKLPYITPSGKFWRRADNQLIQHTGFLCMDMDHLTPEEARLLKETIKQDKFIPTNLLFISPSGRGLKWIIKIPMNADSHEDYFEAIKNYTLATYFIPVDKNCRNISRACYLSYDEEAYLAPEHWNLEPLGEPFLQRWLQSPIEVIEDNNSISTYSRDQKVKQVDLLVKQIVERKKDITSSYLDWFKIAFSLCELGYDGCEYFHQLSQISEKYDKAETDEKYRNLLDNYNGSIKLGTLFYMAKQHGITWKEQHVGTEHTAVSEVACNSINTSIGYRTANQRMLDAEGEAPVKQLVGTLWHTGELHVHFGGNGNGKSVYAMQVANAISKGERALPLLPNENEPLKVLYYDFELSNAQFRDRYCDDEGNAYRFSDLLVFGKINFGAIAKNNPGGNLHTQIFAKIKSDIITLKPQVVIIDNITYLMTQSTQDANVALILINKLLSWKEEYNLSIMVLAHTPKRKDDVPITSNDLAGSSHLSNLVDSVSAIGKSKKGSSEKYIKQTKCRSGENLYGEETVISCYIDKPEDFLCLNFRSLEHEQEHLSPKDGGQQAIEKEMKKQEAFKLRNQGRSLREIQQLTGVGKSTVQRWLNESGLH